MCSFIEPLLPSMEQGRIDHDDLPRIYQGRLVTHAILDHEEILTQRHREVVRLYYRENLEQLEIARQLTITQQAVADALRRAREAVGKKLRAYFPFLESPGTP